MSGKACHQPALVRIEKLGQSAATFSAQAQLAELDGQGTCHTACEFDVNHIWYLYCSLNPTES